MESVSGITYFTMLHPNPLFEWRMIFTISSHHMFSPYCLEITSSKTKCYRTCGYWELPTIPFE